MPADVLEVTKRFMREPIRILVKKEELTLEGIRQFYIEVEQEARVLCFMYLNRMWFCGFEFHSFNLFRSHLFPRC